MNANTNDSSGTGVPGPGGVNIAPAGNLTTVGGLNAATTSTGEPLKIIKTQLIPHQPFQQHLTPLISPTQPTANISHPQTTSIVSSSSSNSSISSQSNLLPHQAHTIPHIQLKNVSNSFSINSVAAKITHVKTTTMDSAGSGISLSNLNASGSTIMTSGVSNTGAIKIATGGPVSTSPIQINTSQTQATATAIRAINSGGQSTQVRVVMPTNIMPTSMIKQLENVSAGRTQITAIPASNARTVSNTSITVTRPVSQTTYLPRATGVTATQMTGVGITTGQRLVTPLRTAPTTVGTVTGLTAAGNFVRGATVSRTSTVPSSTVISPSTNTTWMTTNNVAQVQLIRTIPHQQRQRILTTQNISNASNSVTNVSGGNTGSTAHVSVAQIQPQTQGVQTSLHNVSSQGAPHSQHQPTYVATLATVLPQRQPQATLVYSSTAPTSHVLTQPQQQFTSSLGGGNQRFAVATPLTTGTTANTGPRQIRPIPLGKSFPTAKLNTTSISIRAPNIPTLTPTGITGGITSGTNATINVPRSTTVSGVTGTSHNVIPTTNLSTTRIIQLQQQPGGATQQIIGSTGRLAGNVMLQPILVNTTPKLGIRPPVSMATKVQPALTITHVGKLPTAGSANIQPQNITTSIQAINNSVNSSVSPSTVTSSGPVSNLNTQLINVSQAGQLLTTQNIISSTGGATVVPLAITTRGGATGNILAGTITPIKNANGITVGKVMSQSQVATTTDNTAAGTAVSASGTNVYIHQRTHNVGGSTVAVATTNASNSNNVLTSTVGNSFLPPGSTIYYESMPANSVQVSTGVLSLTTTTVTNSTMSQHQNSGATTNLLPVSSLPFASHAGCNSTATFTVVPSGGARTIGQLQIPVSSAGGAQIQTVPVRFSAQLPTLNVANSAADSIAVTQANAQLLQNTSSNAGTQQILIPAPHTGTNSLSLQAQTQHMVIPLQTSIKVTTGGSGGMGTVVSNFLRKRDNEITPTRAAKNLGPTLLSMTSNTNASSSIKLPTSSGAFSITANSNKNNSGSGCAIQSSGTTALTVEALGKKDRAAAIAAAKKRNVTRNESPVSSDGSTTVSANSSPGVDQQIQDNNMLINRMTSGNSDTTHFNPINELYANHLTTHAQPIIPHSTPTGTRQHQTMEHVQCPTSNQRMNGAIIDCPPRKKTRRSTNDSQVSIQSSASLSLPAPSNLPNTIMNNTSAITDTIVTSLNGLPPPSTNLDTSNSTTNSTTIFSGHKANSLPPTAGNKENAKPPTELILKRPRSLSLLSSYKHSWKLAHNHFQRYSDVKPREERRPSIMDMANQSNVIGRISGWKILHLKSQMEDLYENEKTGYDKLATMLKQIEGDENNSELERCSELVKGNMQRNKIVADGINEALNQMMKIFDHKSHISDIINRCASKRNFKKRDKM